MVKDRVIGELHSISVDHDAELALRLSRALPDFWLTRGHRSGGAWLELHLAEPAPKVAMHATAYFPHAPRDLRPEIARSRQIPPHILATPSLDTEEIVPTLPTKIVPLRSLQP